MSQLIINPAELATMLADVQTARLNTITIGLIQTNLSPLPNTALSALTAAEATFTGYARKTAQNLSGPVIKPDGTSELLGGNQVFLATGSAIQNTIYGYFMCNAAVTELYWWELFDTPVPVGAADDAVAFVPRFNAPTPNTGCVVTD